MPALLQDALQKQHAEAGHWAYTETSVTRDKRGRVQKETVVRHDPSLPYAEQSRLLKINGREPTKLEARRHRDAAEKSRNTKRVTMDDQVDLDHVTVAEETPKVARVANVEILNDEKHPAVLDVHLGQSR